MCCKDVMTARPTEDRGKVAAGAIRSVLIHHQRAPGPQTTKDRDIKCNMETLELKILWTEKIKIITIKRYVGYTQYSQNILYKLRTQKHQASTCVRGCA